MGARCTKDNCFQSSRLERVPYFYGANLFFRSLLASIRQLLRFSSERQISRSYILYLDIMIFFMFLIGSRIWMCWLLAGWLWVYVHFVFVKQNSFYFISHKQHTNTKYTILFPLNWMVRCWFCCKEIASENETSRAHMLFDRFSSESLRSVFRIYVNCISLNGIAIGWLLFESK